MTTIIQQARALLAAGAVDPSISKADTIAALTALFDAAVDTEGYVLALQTVVKMPDGGNELGYTLLDGVGIFKTAQDVSDSIAELSLPLGWVSMTTHQLLPGWMLPAARKVPA